MTFEEEFLNWLQLGLQSDLPGEIKAFSFNLFEPALVDGVKFGVELIGAGEFDENDSDWACDEVWEPEQRQLNIPIEYSGENWEECLEKMKTLVKDILQANQGSVSKLKNVKGIGVGFVDGDLEIVWQP
jgi:hypothetical protein